LGDFGWQHCKLAFGLHERYPSISVPCTLFAFPVYSFSITVAGWKVIKSQFGFLLHVRHPSLEWRLEVKGKGIKHVYNAVRVTSALAAAVEMPAFTAQSSLGY
jgi:hypothetical protein